MAASRTEAHLNYLCVYNPTLTSSEAPADDEDAIEQSHIIFYTSRQQAVSRDKMLRQIGLAKALVTFSDMFGAQSESSSVHSQKQRLLMHSPEPNFWIHASIDLARTQRPSTVGKGKGKQKETPPSKEARYDYHESNTRDSLLKSDIIRAYEEFKLLNGTFESILQRDGISKLEKLLEKFFTVWAWSWELGNPTNFTSHLGTPIHSLSSKLENPSDYIAPVSSSTTSFTLCLTPPSILPLALKPSDVPSVLPHYMLSTISPPPPRTRRSSANSRASTLRASQPAQNTDASNDLNDRSLGAFLSSEFSNPKKWSWPGYLTFRKGKRRPDSAIASLQQTTHSYHPEVAGPQNETKVPDDVVIDQKALEDAIGIDSAVSVPSASNTDETVHIDGEHQSGGEVAQDAPLHGDSAPFAPNATTEPLPEAIIQLHKHRPSLADIFEPPVDVSSSETSSAASSFPVSVSSTPHSNTSPPQTSPPSPTEAVIPSSLTVHIPLDASYPNLLSSRKVYYLSNDGLVFVAMPLETNASDDGGTSGIDFERVHLYLERVRALIDSGGASNVQSPQPSDNPVALAKSPSGYLIHLPQHRLLYPSSTFSKSAAPYLFGVQTIMDRHPELTEILVRSTASQWIASHRFTSRRQSDIEEERLLYIEVDRKDASIVDVDNELGTAIRGWNDSSIDSA